MKRVTLPLLALVTSLAASSPADVALPEGPAKANVAAKCAKCHDLTVVTAYRATEVEWETCLIRMTRRGVQLTDPEFEAMVGYLAANFGPRPVEVNKAPASEFVRYLGLGDHQVKAILDYRKQHGRVPDWEAFLKIIGATAQTSALKSKVSF